MAEHTHHQMFLTNKLPSPTIEHTLMTPTLASDEDDRHATTIDHEGHTMAPLQLQLHSHSDNDAAAILVVLGNESQSQVQVEVVEETEIARCPSRQQMQQRPVRFNSPDLGQPLTIILSYLSLLDYISASRICHLWYVASEKKTSWFDIVDVDRLYASASRYIHHCGWVRSPNRYAQQKIGRWVQMPSIQDEEWFQSYQTPGSITSTSLTASSAHVASAAASQPSSIPTHFSQQPSLHSLLTSSRWNHMRHFILGTASVPPYRSQFQGPLEEYPRITKAHQLMQQELVTNTMKAFVTAQEGQRLGQLEAIELRYSDFDEIQIEQNLLEQFYASLATLPRLHVLISGMYIHPVVSQLIHLKVLIMGYFTSTSGSVGSLALLHQLEYLHLYRLHGKEMCDTIRQLSATYALHTLSISGLFDKSDVGQLCCMDEPPCRIRQFEFSEGMIRISRSWHREYATIMRKMLLGLPQLTNLHTVRWIGNRKRLIVRVEENGEPISTDENRTLIQRLGSLLTLSIHCHYPYSAEPCGTDLRFCTSLTELEWSCSLERDHHHSNRLNQNNFKYLPQLKQLTLRTGILPGCLGVNLIELSVLHQLVQLHIFCATSTSRWIWTDEVFDVLSKLPQFESYTIGDIDYLYSGQLFTFSSAMLRSMIQSRTWANITISIELPKQVNRSVDHPERVVYTNPDHMGWLPVQPNLETKIGSHSKWTNFRERYNSYDYRLRLNGSRFVSPPAAATSTSQLTESDESDCHPPPPLPIKQNYTWLSNLDQDHSHPTTTISTDMLQAPPSLEEVPGAPASCSTCTIC